MCVASSSVSCQTRRGDRAMCMRFWSVNTRETEGEVRQGLSARASHPKARSHDPITAPRMGGVLFEYQLVLTDKMPRLAAYRVGKFEFFGQQLQRLGVVGLAFGRECGVQAVVHDG